MVEEPELTSEQRDMIEKCIEWLESQGNEGWKEIPRHEQEVWVERFDGDEITFHTWHNLKNVTPEKFASEEFMDCGTACCIAGYIFLIKAQEDSAKWLRNLHIFGFTGVAEQLLGMSTCHTSLLHIFDGSTKRSVILEMLKTALAQNSWEASNEMRNIVYHSIDIEERMAAFYEYTS